MFLARSVVGSNFMYKQTVCYATVVHYKVLQLRELTRVQSIQRIGHWAMLRLPFQFYVSYMYFNYFFVHILSLIYFKYLFCLNIKTDFNSSNNFKKLTLISSILGGVMFAGSASKYINISKLHKKKLFYFFSTVFIYRLFHQLQT